MTICNMCIEGGARAGLIAPDDTTFEYVHGRPHAPPGAAWDAAVERWRTLPTDDGATYDKSIRSTPTPSSRWSPTARTPAWASRSPPVPSPDDEADPAPARARASARVHGPPPRPADPRPEGRRRLRRLLHQRPDQRPAPGGRGAQGPPRRRRRRADGHAGLDEVKREAEREGLADIFKAAGADWRESGCSMCIAMNGDQLSPASTRSAPATATSRAARARAAGRSSPRR